MAGNQVLAFGALAAQANLAVDVSVSGSRIAGNMLTAAAALAVGGAGTLSLSVQDSEVVGNMVRGRTGAERRGCSSGDGVHWQWQAGA